MDDPGNYGVSFHGAFHRLAWRRCFGCSLTFHRQVTEEAAEQGFRISDAHLFAGGIGVGENSVLTIDESFQQNNDIMNVYATTLGGPLDTKLSDSVDFENLYTRLRVTKDIFALAGEGSNLPARTTVIDQSFSQEIIPEPATLGLAGLAVIGMALGKDSSKGLGIATPILVSQRIVDSSKQLPTLPGRGSCFAFVAWGVPS